MARYLITPVEVIAKAHVDNNMDPKVFTSHIQIAICKLGDVDGCLGHDYVASLFADARDFVDYETAAIYSAGDVVVYGGKYYTAINNGTTGIIPTNTGSWTLVDKFQTPANQLLWDTFLWQILALMVQHTSLFTNSIRTTSQGEMKNNTGNSAGADFKDVKAKKDEIADNIRVLEKAMLVYMQQHKDEYPLWAASRCNDTKCDKRPSMGVFLKRSKKRNSCDC